MNPLRKRLTTASGPLFAFYAIFASFCAYFCMYAFRKPFAAGSFEGEFGLLGIDLKTGLVISQILGYAISKYIGIKVCSEITPGRRAIMLVGLILWAEGALVIVGVAPGSWKALGLVLNGLSLGMIWGLVVWYLEGRRTSELLLAGLSCSYIIASAVVKDVGLWLMDMGVSEAWMPAATGGCFLAPYLVSVWLLNQLPPPDEEDVAARVEREPMGGKRLAFLSKFAFGLTLLFVFYFFLTAHRDFRDNYGKELLTELNIIDQEQIFTRIDTPIALGVLVMLAALILVKDNRKGLVGALVIIIAGTALMGISTLMFRREMIDGFWWMVLVGLGTYLAYVPFGSVVFERMIASTRTVGTAVFAIYVADALGYTGSVGMQIYKDLGQSESSRLDFFMDFTIYLSGLGVVALVIASVYFWVRCRPAGKSSG